MPTPGDLSLCLERLLAAGLSNADYTRLHHFSLQGRRVYLTGGINYFGTHSALQGSNIALADRCMYVASQLEGGRTDKDSIIEEALNRWPLIPGQTDPSKASDSMRDYWLRQLRAIGPDFGVEPDDYNLLSPTFRLGGWRVGVEHQRAFKSVVVQWIGPPEEVPEHPRRWKGCPPSDLDKGWQFRAPSSPEQLHQLLSELRDSQASKPAFVDQFSALGPAASRETVVTVRDRAPAVRERVLQRAAGHCEWCGKLGFKTVSGAVYLETHHVIPLAEDGPDHETNMLALCPDDHRRAHHAHDREDLTDQLRGKLDELCVANSSTGSRT
jgi:hypothetical protein